MITPRHQPCVYQRISSSIYKINKSKYVYINIYFIWQTALIYMLSSNQELSKGFFDKEVIFNNTYKKTIRRDVKLRLTYHLIVDDSIPSKQNILFQIFL